MKAARRTMLLVALDLAIDQASKTLATGPGRRFFLVHPIRNPAFSLQMANSGRWAEMVAMTALLSAAVVVAIRLGVKAGVPSWATGLILGGAASNLLDRAIFGSVRDFLLVGPVVINLADVAVLLGLVAAYGSWATGRGTVRGINCSAPGSSSGFGSLYRTADPASDDRSPVPVTDWPSGRRTDHRTG